MKLSTFFTASVFFFIAAPVTAEQYFTVGFGQTSNTLDTGVYDEPYEQDWMDVDLTYTYAVDKFLRYSLNYRTAVSATHDNIYSGGTHYESDLTYDRTSATVSLGNLYLGYLQYGTYLGDATTLYNPITLDVEVGGITMGLAGSSQLGDSGIYFQYGVGVLYAVADVVREYENKTYTYSYDETIGYSVAAGLAGKPPVLNGIAWALKAEFQTITFEESSLFGDQPVMEDTFTRISLNLTY